MEPIWVFLKENLVHIKLVHIKDVSTILFAGIASIVAILSYIGARRTILQPLRNVVIKKQLALLSEIYGFFQKNDREDVFDQGIDYKDILHVNIRKVLEERSLDQLVDVPKMYEDEQLGFLLCRKGKLAELIEGVELASMFKNGDGEGKYHVIKSRAESAAGKKSVDSLCKVNRIWTTPKYNEYMNTLNGYSDSPFLPSMLRFDLKQINREIMINLKIKLRDLIEDFLENFYDKYNKEDGVPKIDMQGIYVIFHNKRVDHRPSIKKFRSDIRKFLRVDEEWK